MRVELLHQRIKEDLETAGGVFEDDAFFEAVRDGLTERRLVQVRNGYLLVDNTNRAYDPSAEQQELERKGFSGQQLLAKMILYKSRFGLLDPWPDTPPSDM